MVLLTRRDTTASDRIHEGLILNLRVDYLQHPDGHQFKREVVEHNGGVVIACQPEPDKVVLIRQYRYPIDEELLELPAGRLEKGEQALPAAQRELTEETGLQATVWEELPAMYSAPGFCTEVLYFFRARDVKFVGKSLDEDEETEVLVMPVAEAWQLVVNKQIRDCKTVAGIALLRG